MGKKLQKKSRKRFSFCIADRYGGHMSQMLLRCDHSGSRVQTMKHYGKSVSLFVLEVLSLALLQAAVCGIAPCESLPPRRRRGLLLSRALAA